MPAAARSRREVLPAPARSRGAVGQVRFGARGGSAPALPGSAAATLTILVMASHPARATRMILEEWGHAVVMAGSKGTPDASEWQKADLVLVDLDGWGPGALAAVAAVRCAESGIGGHVPVIALAADAAGADLAVCKDAGADARVPTPLDPDTLNGEIDRLGALVARWRLTRACLDPAAWSRGWRARATSGGAVWGARQVRHRFALPGM